MKPLDIAGHKVSWWWVIGGVTGAAVVVVIVRKNASSAAAAPGSDTSGIDPLTGLPVSQDNQTDPLTGMPYLEEAQEFGSVAAAESAVAGSGAEGGLLSEGGGGVVDSGFPTFGNGGSPAPSPAGYPTFAAWAQAVQSGLTSLGYSSQSVATALGLFNAGHSLSSAQAAIIRTAEAEFGPPPGGPFPIISTPSSGNGARVRVPDVKGMTFGQAQQILHDAGFKAVRNSAGYHDPVKAQEPAAGAEEAAGTTVRLDGTPQEPKPVPPKRPTPPGQPGPVRPDH